MVHMLFWIAAAALTLAASLAVLGAFERKAAGGGAPGRLRLAGGRLVQNGNDAGNTQ